MKVSANGSSRVEPLGERQQQRPVDQVDLVEDEEFRRALLAQSRENRPRRLADLGRFPLAGRALPAPISWRASTSSASASASPAAPQAAATIARSSRRLGANRPGVSTKIICAAPSTRMPRTVARVVCALRETIDTFAPISELSSVDLPALGAPTSATKPQRLSLMRRSDARGTPVRRPVRRRAWSSLRRFPARSRRAPPA